MKKKLSIYKATISTASEMGRVAGSVPGRSTNLELIGQVSSMLAVGAGGRYYPLSLSFFLFRGDNGSI